MIIGRIEGATRVLGPPANWDSEREGKCLPLAIRDEQRGDGSPEMVSAWIPTPDEIARIAAGAAIHLHIVGRGHPPVMLTVGEAPAAPVAEVPMRLPKFTRLDRVATMRDAREFRERLHQLGVVLPLNVRPCTERDSGEIQDSGSPALSVVVDRDRERPDQVAWAIAVWIAMAVNTCAGFKAIAPPADEPSR